LLVGSAPFGFGVDDPATRRGRLQTLGLGAARLTAPLVPSGRASCSSESWRCMATSRSVALRRCVLAWASRSEGSGIPPTTAWATSSGARPDALAAVSSHPRAAGGFQVFAVDEQLYGPLD
jgi:hypothetical protein